MRPFQPLLFLYVLSLILICCSSPSPSSNSEETEDTPLTMQNITTTSFGQLPDGTPVNLYTLTNSSGIEVQITNYGGIITSIQVPDQAGNMGEVTLSFDSLQSYLAGHPYFGALVGRYGNRIDKGSFSLNGETITLPAINNGPNHLHGGLKGFDKVVWEAETVSNDTGVGLVLTYVSADGEEGYPGKLEVTVTYTLKMDQSIEIAYLAQTDKPTILNLTNHTYFNLKDGGASPILDHVVSINADRFTPVDESLIPTGELASVEGTPFDFRNPTKISAGIDADHQQIAYGGGYDHNWVFNESSAEIPLQAKVEEPTTGRIMEVFTTQPGVQFYCGNFLDGSLTGRGKTYGKRHGLCLETQHFPDSPNHPNFPTTTLNPGETYAHTTIYKFRVKE